MPTTPEGDAAPPRAARGDLGQRPIAIGLLVLIVLLAGGAASIALLGSGGSPAPGATVLDPSGGIASSPSAGLDTSADFRFLPALITPPLLPAPTAVPSASPGATPTTGSGLSFDLAPGVAAPRDSTSVWIGWTGAGGSKLKGRVTIEAGLDQGALHRVVLNPSATRILRPAQTGHDYVYRINVSASAGAAAESVTAAFRLRSVDDRDRSIAYSGTWASAGAGGYLGGSARFSKRPGSTATLTFVGQSVAWIGPVGPRRGQATVS
ncbi:MAG TPA: hypothetical protein VHS36_09140, partial [Candidatus Limnocylindrales bacterium]|nr:hypothetical protein [Candidatus Limnocylindrales bacterium]